ncbi:DUF3307 domain-containing protein [Actinoplanes sp. NPDC051494]|uniref:DUF3307 domain-containing protein n=1 Tax=Actinoplanes sp. NPDC051494 TaxID=3363907 RepID=UPI0037B0745D
MLPDTTAHVATFTAVFVALFVAHQLADHWIQTQHQADHKGDRGWVGRLACAAHVASYTVTSLLALLALPLFLGLALSPGRVAAGLLISAVTHYIADRRTPLKRLAEAIGSGPLHALGVPREGRDDNPSLGTGSYALDQSFHYLFLFVAALVIAA